MAFYSPVGNSQFTDLNGKPLVGGTLSTFLAGTSTPQTTFTTEAGNVPQGAVMTLNSYGLPENGQVWINSGQPLDFILKDSAGVLIENFDNITGINDSSIVLDEWVLYSGTFTYLSPNSFSVPGDQVNTFQVGRRVKTENTGGTSYGTILTSVYVNPNTTVTLTNTSGTLDSGLSSISYGFLAAQNSSLPGIYAQLASPAFTGVPTAPTAAPATNTTQIANTEFVQTASSSLSLTGGTVAGNAMTLGTLPGSISFRSTSLTNGATVRVAVGTLSLVLPSGATFGASNATLTRLVLLVAYNAGTPVLCVANISGGFNFDETLLISPTTISAGSTSFNTVYSSSAVASNSPFRVIGYVEFTQATAGVYATAATLLQSAFGEAAASLQSFGYGQTWQSVIGSRAIGTNYTNTTSRPIMVSIYGSITTGGNAFIATIGGIDSVLSPANYAAAASTSLVFVVPPGALYNVRVSGGTPTVTTWAELR